MRFQKINAFYSLQFPPLRLVICLPKNAVHDPSEAVALVDSLTITVNYVDLHRNEKSLNFVDIRLNIDEMNWLVGYEILTPGLFGRNGAG